MTYVEYILIFELVLYSHMLAIQKILINYVSKYNSYMNTNTNTNNFILDKSIQIEVTLLYVYIYTSIYIHV